jgi:hypothetical protein
MCHGCHGDSALYSIVRPLFVIDNSIAPAPQLAPLPYLTHFAGTSSARANRSKVFGAPALR